MTYQHREFKSRLRDAESLRLYAQSVVSNHRGLSASLAKAESRSRCWEMEAKEGVEKMARAKAESDAARHEASMARMDADVVDRLKTWCVKCTPMCASAHVAPSNIVYQRYGYRSTGTGVLTTKVLLLR